MQLVQRASPLDRRGLFTEDKEYWIGGTMTESEDAWLWIDGVEWKYTNWSPANPDNYLGIQRCVKMYNNGTWDDDMCDKKYPFICKK
ncbi:lectin C-type domain protein [Teladorsagia circumcincta]|uniref:Lectin C-type domain protein n=1 Tax=Teladorsagia circumcincta TaxID=45464 RepID=A0A2G9U4U4_TELCI|nr:lectin C-type domain protein [Teladorsagia circumcincta]